MATQLANIGPAGRNQRLSFGIILFGAVGLAAAVLILGHYPRAWRLLLLLPLWAAALGVFQARRRT
jgi:tetrahydromethanopterin S-methyltransferase subunit F